jgi:hypothetical protein
MPLLTTHFADTTVTTMTVHDIKNDTTTTTKRATLAALE